MKPAKLKSNNNVGMVQMKDKTPNHGDPQHNSDPSLDDPRSSGSHKGGTYDAFMEEGTDSASSEVSNRMEEGKAMATKEMDHVKEELKEQLDEVKEQVQEAVTGFFSELLNGVLDGIGLNIDKIETPYVDMYNLPGVW
jgi:hypothetical protein